MLNVKQFNVTSYFHNSAKKIS